MANFSPLQFTPLVLWLSFCASLLFSVESWSGELKVKVSDKKNRPLEGVVITLEQKGHGQGAASSPRPLAVSIEQINREFVPAVTVIPVGSSVLFPNQDDILHHVYSFSKAKTFDLPLYKGIPNEPVVFDAPGVAALGCNIHDWMSAHVVIVDTPYYQLSDTQGSAHLIDIAAGDYELRVWHPRQKKAYSENITVAEQTLERSIVMRLKPTFRSRRQNSNSGRDY